MATDQTRERIFISYSHKDNEERENNWLERIQAHLRPLTRSGMIDLWDDTHLLPGLNWKQTIEEKIDSAKIAIFLVSANFLASDYIHNQEIPPLLAKADQSGTRLISIILSPCQFDSSPLAIYQSINSPSRPLIKMDKGDQEGVFNALATFIKSTLQVSSYTLDKENIPDVRGSQKQIESKTFPHEISVQQGNIKKIYLRQLNMKML